MTKKTTKRSLAMSILSLVLCLAMLIGSTYAWFSDTASTGKVTITAGNLKVGIQTVAEEGQEATDLENQAIPFGDVKDGQLKDFEPGKMYVSDQFEIVNKGNLALKYELKATVKGTESQTPDLSKVVKVLVVPASEVKTEYDALKVEGGDTIANRRALWTKAEEASKVENTKNVIIPADVQEPQLSENQTQGKSDALVAIVFWNPTDSTLVYSQEPTEEEKEANPDNEYNVKDGNLSMSFTLNVEATQAPFEEDAFGTDYDKGIEFSTEEAA